MIGIKSQLGIGSTFWIELPHIESQRELINNNGNLANFDSEGNTRTGTILYIEDNSSNLDLVEQILLNHRPGLHLISDMYGNSAVKLVILHQPDLILLDLDLPDVHGSEVLKLLKGNEKTSHIPRSYCKCRCNVAPIGPVNETGCSILSHKTVRCH